MYPSVDFALVPSWNMFVHLCKYPGPCCPDPESIENIFADGLCLRNDLCFFYHRSSIWGQQHAAGNFVCGSRGSVSSQSVGSSVFKTIYFHIVACVGRSLADAKSESASLDSADCRWSKQW